MHSVFLLVTTEVRVAAVDVALHHESPQRNDRDDHSLHIKHTMA
jgi:hypothetical protein